MNELCPCFVDLSSFNLFHSTDNTQQINSTENTQSSVILYDQKYTLQKMNELILFPFSKDDCIEWFWAQVSQKLLRAISVVKRTNIPTKISFMFHPKLFLMVFGMENFQQNTVIQKFDTESLLKMIPQSHFQKKKKSSSSSIEWTSMEIKYRRSNWMVYIQTHFKVIMSSGVVDW
jgi:hypothetical protein